MSEERSAVQHIAAFRRSFVRRKMTANHILSCRMTGTRSLKYTNMASNSLLEFLRNNIVSIWEKYEVREEERRDWSEVAQNIFGIDVRVFFKDGYIILPSKNKEKLLNIYI